MILFSIIIPTYHRPASLALCLDRLRPGAQTLQAARYEVIVSDDGKNNEAKAMVETAYPWAQWLEGPKRGPAANRNHGAKQAKGNWLVFTDDDCLPDSNWLMAYEKAMKDYPNGKAFEGTILPDDWNLLKKDMAECPVNTYGGCFWSANIMIEKKLFDTIGGFDEQFKIAAQEDQDLQIQVLKQTGIVFAKEALVMHPVRFGTLANRSKKIFRDTLNWHKYYRKEHHLVQAVTKAMTSQILALLAALKNKKWRTVIYHGLYICSVTPFLLYAEFKQQTK